LRCEGDRQAVRHEECRIVHDEKKTTAGHSSDASVWGRRLAQVDSSDAGLGPRAAFRIRSRSAFAGILPASSNPTCPNGDRKDPASRVGTLIRNSEMRPRRGRVDNPQKPADPRDPRVVTLEITRPSDQLPISSPNPVAASIKLSTALYASERGR
jgi:hypothetical protein